jgi:hypothetical protein
MMNMMLGFCCADAGIHAAITATTNVSKPMQTFLMADLSELSLFALHSGRTAETAGSTRSLRH